MRKVTFLWLLAAAWAVSYAKPEGERGAEEPLDAFPAEEASLGDDAELENTRREGEEAEEYFGEDLQLENSPRDGEETDAAEEVNEYTDMLSPLDRERRGASVDELSEIVARQKRRSPYKPRPHPHPRPKPHPHPKPRPYPRYRR